MIEVERGRFVLGAVGLLVLVVVPVAIAGAAGDSAATPEAKSAGLRKKLKKVQKQVSGLQQQLAVLQEEQGGARPPSGAAGGDLTGSYPNPRIAANAIGGAKVIDGSLTGADVEGLTGADVEDDSLLGADVNEATLSGQSGLDAASVGGIGPSELGTVGRSGSGALCSDNDEDGEDCATVSLTLPRPGRVLVIGTSNWGVASFDDGSGPGSGTDSTTAVRGVCVLQQSPGGPLAGTARNAAEVQGGADPSWSGGAVPGGALSTTHVTGLLAAGAYTFAFRCTEQDGDIDWIAANVSAVMLGSA